MIWVAWRQFRAQAVATLAVLAAVIDCLARYDLHESITYQPESHYWELQWYETGIFAALGGLLSGFCFWWIRRRQN
ncbi:MAG TPA: hypothetical protein VGM10_04250 [Actinocrinis sp.]|jgi:hypothetical protein